MRKMATVRRVDAVNPIPDADAIEVATVGGWRVVIKKGEFVSGDLAVYCEIDSWIPNDLAPFLSKGSEPRVYNGVAGERLRTVKLRGQVSQGLLLPHDIVWDKNMFDFNRFDAGDDVSELLNIQKWEAPIPAQLAGEVRGMFPGFIPKTDQERIQNLTAEFADWTERKLHWEVTEKLDGSSMTVYVFDDDEGVCSRNLNLRETEGNSLWTVARRNDLIGKIRSTGQNLA
jgi:RNA ligase (TIGR02306 family)